MTNPQGSDRPFPYGSVVFAACILIFGATWSLMKTEWKERPLVGATAKTAVEKELPTQASAGDVEQSHVSGSLTAPDLFAPLSGVWTSLTPHGIGHTHVGFSVTAGHPDVLQQRGVVDLELAVSLLGIRYADKGTTKEALFEVRRYVRRYADGHSGGEWLATQFSMRDGDIFHLPVRGGRVIIAAYECEGDCVTLALQ